MSGLSNGHDKYGQAALDAELATLAGTARGRNHAANVASFKIGSLTIAGVLDRKEVEPLLFQAAEQNGSVGKHGANAMRATIASGLNAGEKQPRVLPEAARVNGASRPKPQPIPPRPQEPAKSAPQLRDVPIPDWTEPVDDKPKFFAIGLAEPRPMVGELRRHVYRRGTEPVRIKVKRESGWLDCYRVRNPDGVVGWQARKPRDFVSTPYLGPVGAIDGFDPEIANETLWWTEGEKDVDSLQAVGLAAFSFGSASDVPPCGDLLHSRDVVILGDNDEAGERGIERKAAMARSVAARVRTVRFTELQAGGDVSDFLEAGGTAEGLLERAEDVVAEAPKSQEAAPGPERFDTAGPSEPFIINPGAKPSKPEPRVTAVSAAELQGMTFAPIRYVVPGYVVEGCTLLAGAPKLGKSWMALEMAYSKASGGTCLGSIKTGEPADVLYLALEDNLRRLQSRMEKLTLAGEGWPARLTLATEWPRSNEGGLDRIREWARAAANPRLAIVDVFTMFRAPTTGRENAYEADYVAIKGIQSLAAELGIAIVVVHHTRKSRDQVDPFDRVSGTLGLSGAADAVLILDRDGNGVTLYGRGRDIPEIETAVQFNKDTCRWKVQGSAAEVHRSDERSQILEVLKVTPTPMTPSEVTAATRLNGNQCKVLLFRMHVKGEVMKVGRGKYIHPDRTDLLDTP